MGGHTRLTGALPSHLPHQVHFLIGGDGPKRAMLEAVVARHHLEGRVELLGDVPHSRVRSVLARGRVFLNASLTESFCMAALEAACCGLLVVATAVGGVPEILPPEILLLAPPRPAALADALDEAVGRLPAVDPEAQHRAVRAMYHWGDVAERVEAVYTRALGAGAGQGVTQSGSGHARLCSAARCCTRPTGGCACSEQMRHALSLTLLPGCDMSLAGRTDRLRRCGPFAGPIFCLAAASADLFQRWLVRSPGK